MSLCGIATVTERVAMDFKMLAIKIDTKNNPETIDTRPSTVSICELKLLCYFLYIVLFNYIEDIYTHIGLILKHRK